MVRDLPTASATHDHDDDFDELDDFSELDQLAPRTLEEVNAEQDAREFTNLIASLREHRLGAGLTQRAVAIRMHTTQSAVSDIEGGDCDPRLMTLLRYARAINMRLPLRMTTPNTNAPEEMKDCQVIDASMVAAWRDRAVAIRPSTSISVRNRASNVRHLALDAWTSHSAS